MKKTNRIIAVVLMVLMCVSFAACSGGAKDAGKAGVKIVAKSLVPSMMESEYGVAINTTTDLVVLNEDGTYLYVNMVALHPSWDIKTIGFNTVVCQMGTYTITTEDEYGIDATLNKPDRVVVPGEYDESGFVILSYADSDKVDDATKTTLLADYTEERHVSIDAEKHTFTVE
ncbi:MAG: hypothetical protein IJ138_00675 [Clostridia bacterium]|nr:hypothetical protein [Clostridia bacterium]